MNPILVNQLSIDYCCAEADILDERNHFTEFFPHPDRRRYDDPDDCFLKICAVNSKLLVNGHGDIVSALEPWLRDYGGEWFLEAGPLRKLDGILQPYGYQIRRVHPFYVCDTPSPADTSGWDIQWYEPADIAQFEGDGRFSSAFTFLPAAPDMLGVAALRNGEICAMAGASGDSPQMWQIGINTLPHARKQGAAGMLVKLIKNEILRRGALPFYGTALSHLASQKTALNAGFKPAWGELVVEKREPKRLTPP